MRLLFLLSVVILLSFPTQSWTKGIEFFKGSWEQALEKAGLEDKIIFVDAYAQWCGPCKRMAKTVFTTDKAGEFFNKNFINFKMDMESEPGREFGKKYPVSAYPTLFFINSEGKIVLNTKGAQNLEGLIKLGNSALQKGLDLESLEAKYQEGNRDVQFLYKYVKALNKSNKSPLKVANAYLRSQKNLQTEFNRKFIYESLYTADSKIFQWFVEDRQEIEKIFGKDPVENQIEKACRRTFAQAIKFDTPDLWQEARTKAKDNLGSKGEKMAMEFDLDYYAHKKENKLYLKTTKSYVKTHVKNNAALLDATAKRLLTDFKEDEKILRYAEGIAAKASENGGLAEYHQTYAKILLASKKHGLALEEAKKALAIAKNYGAYTKDIEILIKKIEGA